MKSRPEPYSLRHIQTDRNRGSGDHELAVVYSFFAESRKYDSLFRYIVRAEKYKDCFAIKYYCTRIKHSEHKYSRVLNLFSAVETKRIMETAASVIPTILSEYPLASFAFNGSRTFDRSDYIEGAHCTQRYRIYVELVRRLFGEKVFYISTYDNSSSCIFVNRSANPDVEEAKTRIYNMFANIFEVTI